MKKDNVLITRPVPLKNLLTEESLKTIKPQSLSIDSENWRNNFGEYEDYDERSGVYVFLWNGAESNLPLVTDHWVKGKQKGSNDPGELPAGVRHMPSITLKGKKSKTEYVHYHAKWSFRSTILEEENYFPLYVGKSTNVVQRIQQHLYWPGSYAKKYVKTLSEHRQRGYFRVPRYNTASQFSDHFHFMFRHNKNEEGVRDLGQKLKIENISISVIFLPFADYAERFFLEDHLIGQLRPPFNLDSER